MEFYSNKNLFVSFKDEERNATQSPSHPSNFIRTYHSSQEMSDQQQIQFSPPRSPTSTTLLTMMPPQCPGSPWTRSPLHTPSPSLIYHCIASLVRGEGNVYSIAISKGLVFTGSSSTRIHAWRHPDCAERGYLKASSGEVRAILTHGHTLFSAHKDHRIRVWNFSVSDHFRAKKLCTLPKRSSFPSFPKQNAQQHEDCISCMAYYNAEGLLYTGSYDKTVKVWRVSERRCVDAFVAHEDHVNAMVVNQDDGCVFTCSFDGSVKIWRRVFGENSHTLTMTLKFQESPVNALALSTSITNCFLYSGSSDGTINFWEKEKCSGRFNHGGFLQGHRFAVLCLSATEKLMFSGSEDTTIRVWRREEGSCFHECLAVLEGHRGPVKCIAACLEMEKVVMGFLVYSAGLDQTLKVWRIKIFPEEKMQLDYMERTDSSNKMAKTLIEYHEISPVLSPSWVERKLSGHHFRMKK